MLNKIKNFICKAVKYIWSLRPATVRSQAKSFSVFEQIAIKACRLHVDMKLEDIEDRVNNMHKTLDAAKDRIDEIEFDHDIDEVARRSADIVMEESEEIPDKSDVEGWIEDHLSYCTMPTEWITPSDRQGGEELRRAVLNWISEATRQASN